MTEKALRSLTRKRHLTSGERKRVMREANRLLNSAINAFATVQDSCQEAADELRDNDEMTMTQEDRADHLEDIGEELEELVEKLDNLDIPELREDRV